MPSHTLCLTGYVRAADLLDKDTILKGDLSLSYSALRFSKFSCCSCDWSTGLSSWAGQTEAQAHSHPSGLQPGFVFHARPIFSHGPPHQLQYNMFGCTTAYRVRPSLAGPGGTCLQFQHSRDRDRQISELQASLVYIESSKQLESYTVRAYLKRMQPGLMAHMYSPSIWEVEAGRLGCQVILRYQVSFQVSSRSSWDIRGPVSENKVTKMLRASVDFHNPTSDISKWALIITNRAASLLLR